MIASAHAAETVAETSGRYQLQRQLATGGMGTVYLAFDKLARREVVYKRLKVGAERSRPRLTALFEREYDVLRQLKHPHIVEVYDYGVDAEGPFYTMERVAGRDLAEAEASLPLVEACHLLRDVASALALVHARRLVHRDVTPANVRLTPAGRAKLLDFGALAEFGVAREIVGTPAFIAPECLSGGTLDGRTDLFALGALAYWVLTRRHAYLARSVSELLDAWEVPVTPPSEYVPTLPKELDELIMSLMEREPAARPPSAAHVIEQLNALVPPLPGADDEQVAHSFLLHPPLVGRDVVLQQIERFADEAAAGKGRSVWIEAAAGMGRSALLDRVAIRAQLAGSNMLRFQPNGRRDAGLAHAILPWLRAVSPELLREQRLKHAVLANETAAPRPATAESGPELSQRRARLAAALCDCIEEMSKLAPVTLLVDDLQRADSESLAILASLSRIAPGARLLVIVSQQKSASGSDENTLSKLRASATMLGLKPLEERDVESLVASVFGNAPNCGRVARFLLTQSGGVPGSCMDLCRLLLQDQQIRCAHGRFTLPFDPRTPQGDAHALELTRIGNLSESAMVLVHTLALHESALSIAQLANATALSPEQVFACGEELAARDLARQREQELALASESLRRPLRDALSASERQRLHLAIARSLLESAPATLELKFMACHHLLQAQREDEALALVWRDLVCTQIPLEHVASCVPVLEQLLAVQRRRGRSDEQCWPLLAPLLVAGFWGELGANNRHRDAALNALARLTGLALARRLAPRIGKKPALILGIVWGIVRFAFTPRHHRAPSFAALMQRFFSSVTMSTATAASSLEPETALRIAAYLDPIEAMKENSPGRVAREFALATAEVGAGMNARAAQRYARAMGLLDRERIFSDSVTREGFYDAFVHGRAQAEVTLGEPNALEMADVLARRHPFFRPHVETIRMTFHGYRGEKELADGHRRQGETLALQGGVSWSAFTLIAIRSAYISMVSQDTLGVLQASVELERLSALAPNALVYRDLCEAYVCLTRGEHDAALAIYERLAAMPHARLRPAWELDCVFHAEALIQLGRLEEARQLCEEAARVRAAQGVSLYVLRLVQQQRAQIEARLGHFEVAKQLLGELQPAVEHSQGPLQIGSLHREFARVAMLEKDAAAFDTHFAATLEAFRKTKNPALLQQCRKLLAQAERSGLVATPTWEKHQLAAPANTQDLASSPPDVTELVETK